MANLQFVIVISFCNIFIALPVVMLCLFLNMIPLTQLTFKQIRQTLSFITISRDETTSCRMMNLIFFVSLILPFKVFFRRLGLCRSPTFSFTDCEYIKVLLTLFVRHIKYKLAFTLLIRFYVDCLGSEWLGYFFFSELLIRRELGQLQIYLLYGMRRQIAGGGLRVNYNLLYKLVV